MVADFEFSFSTTPYIFVNLLGSKPPRISALDVKAALDANAYKLPKMNSIGAHLFRHKEQEALGLKLSDEANANVSTSASAESADAGTARTSYYDGRAGGVGGGASAKRASRMCVCSDDSFTGALFLTVHSLEGLGLLPDEDLATLLALYVGLEVDSFGQFCLQAKTQCVKKSDLPKWDQVSFHLLLYYTALFAVH